MVNKDHKIDSKFTTFTTE